jgi:hypothetical protein
MENKAADIDRVLDEDEQIVMETTRMRPYLDIWDVSSFLITVSYDWRVKHSYTLHPHENPKQGVEHLSANTAIQFDFCKIQ